MDIKLIFITIILLFASCSKDIEEYETITIKKGNHRSDYNPSIIYESQIQGIIIFEDSWEYDIDTDQTDKNKVFGMCPGLFDVNWDNLSWRMSCYYKDSYIHLGAYVYDVDRREEEGLDPDKPYKIPIAKVKLNEPFYYLIKDLGDSIQYTIKDKTIYVRCTNHQTGVYWKNSVYFGGNRVAPHDMKLKHKEL